MYYDLTIILDRGLSYEALVPLLDPSATPVILRPNGNITLNPFDTQGLPSTSELTAQLAALVSLMCGAGADEKVERLRRAVAAKYTRQLRADSFEEWAKVHPQQLDEVARLACVLEEGVTKSRWLPLDFIGQN